MHERGVPRSKESAHISVIRTRARRESGATPREAWNRTYLGLFCCFKYPFCCFCILLFRTNGLRPDSISRVEPSCLPRPPRHRMQTLKAHGGPMRLFCSQLLQVSAFAQPLFPPLPSLPPPSKLVEANQGGAAAVAAYALEPMEKKENNKINI